MDLSRFDNTGFDRGASAPREALWLVVRQIVFLACPMPWYALRRGLLRQFGARIGQGVVVKPQVKIAFPWKLEVGDHAWLGEESWILNLAPVTIGPSVCISQRAFLCAGNHDWSDPRFRLVAQPIRIGEGAWIGANVFVGPGVTVGAGAVATVSSVVTGDLPDGMICSGNPCRPVKPRDQKSG